jgi:hypothetical protein
MQIQQFNLKSIKSLLFWGCANSDDYVLSVQLGTNFVCRESALNDRLGLSTTSNTIAIYAPSSLLRGHQHTQRKFWWMPYSTQLYYPQDFPRHSHLSLPLNGWLPIARTSNFVDDSGPNFLNVFGNGC